MPQGGEPVWGREGLRGLGEVWVGVGAETLNTIQTWGQERADYRTHPWNRLSLPLPPSGLLASQGLHPPPRSPQAVSSLLLTQISDK